MTGYETKSYEKFPKCNKKNCFANYRGRCDCLIENKYPNKNVPWTCPFYKDKNEFHRESRYSGH